MRKNLKRPDPPVPANLDLRRFPWMPQDVVAVPKYILTVGITAEQWLPMYLLWARAWHEVPAGSLPADDRVLAHYAGYGHDVAAWKTVRDGAMTGFVEHSDGRFYHPMVTEQALYAGEKQAANKSRTTAAQAVRHQRYRERNDERNVHQSDIDKDTDNDTDNDTKRSTDGGAAKASQPLAEDIVDSIIQADGQHRNRRANNNLVRQFMVVWHPSAIAKAFKVVLDRTANADGVISNHVNYYSKAVKNQLLEANDPELTAERFAALYAEEGSGQSMKQAKRAPRRKAEVMPGYGIVYGIL
jgi:hypothetical protein